MKEDNCRKRDAEKAAEDVLFSNVNIHLPVSLTDWLGVLGGSLPIACQTKLFIQTYDEDTSASLQKHIHIHIFHIYIQCARLEHGVTAQFVRRVGRILR